MASYDAAINFIVNGGSKIDKIINKAAQLESIVNDINKKPLEVNVTKVTSAFDTLESNLKATRSTLLSQQKTVDQAANSIDNYTNQIVDLQRRLNELNPNTKKYNDLLNKKNEAIRDRAAAEKEANASLERIEKTQRKLVGLEKDTGRAKAAKEAAIAVENLADSYLRLSSAQQKSANESSIASLSAQAEALKLVANNSQVASSQFNRFAIATQAASQKIFEARQKQLGALAFGLSPEAPKVNIGRSGVGSIAGARGLVGSLIASGSEVVKSEAALSDYAERLRALQSLVPYTSNEFRVLEEAIAGVNQEVSQIGLRGQKSAIQSLAGPATDLGSLKAFQLRESFQKKINDQLNRQDSIQERISQASLFDFQKKKLTLQLDEAVAALAENRLGDAQRLTREIDRQRISMERMNRAAQKPQVFGALGTAFMPVTGELPGGKLVPGSPAAKAAEAKANRESTQAAVALAKQKQKAIEEEAEELRKGTQAATALGKQKLKALEDEARRLRQETADAVALAQQKMREEERAIAAWKMRGGPALPPSMGGGAAGVRGQAFRAGGPGAATAALSAPKRVESLVRSTQLAQERLNELEIRGVDVTAEKASAQKILNSLKEKDLQISDQLLNNVDDELNLIRDVLRLEKQRLTNQRLLGGGGASKKAGPEGTGLEQALKRLEEARGARQKFLGDVSPAQAIDKIVREFNQGASTGGDQGAAQAAENVVGTYAQRITAGVPAVADAMMKLGKAGIDAIKKALGIASPSTVMLAIAKNQIDTYVDFLRAALPVVEAAAKSLGEAGTPKTSGVPESAIRKPITEKARTRPLTAEQLDRNSVIAEYAASQITGPMGQFEQVKQKIENFIDRTRTSVDLDKLFGGQESERFAMATRGVSAGPEFDKLRSALADFYQVPAELTPDLERGAKAASKASTSADELTKYVSELASGIEQIGVFLQSAAKLSAPAAVVDNEFTRAQEAAAREDAAAAEAARKKAEAQKPFEASIQRAAELDAEAKRKADAAVSSVVQAQIEADAKAGAEAISKSILDPIESAAPEGERQVRSAIGNLFDRVTGALGFGGGGGGRPPVPPTGGGPTRDPEDFNRRLSTAAEQGAEALLGLQELRDPTKATTLELEALSGVLKEFRKILDPTVEGFDRLEKQLRESAANLDRQLERRAPGASFLTRKFDPRVARGLSEGLIGGAFPLLFGQGLGAAVGGGAGGFAGGFAGGGLGFGLSLVGTALGTAFDTAVQGAIELGTALEKPVENFDQLAQKSFFSSKALEDTIKKTIEYGDTATASALIQEEAIKKLGVGGVQNLKVLGTESDRLNRAFAELGQQMQVVAAGPLASVIGFFANIAGQAAAAGKVKLLRANLNEEQAGQFNQEILGRLKERGIQRGFFASSAPTESEVGILAQQGALQDIVDKWQAIQIKGQIKIDPKQLIESKINALQKSLEAMDIGKSLKDQVRSAAREQQDLDKQRADLVRSYEESIGNIRKQVEDEVRNRRLAVLETENQILDQQGQNRISQLRLINQQFIASAGQGQRPEVEDAAKRAAQIVAQFTEQQLSAEEEAAQVKRNASLDALKFDTEAAEFKANIEKEISRLNIETARRVDDINLSVARRNEEYDQNRFKLEKRIAQLQLKNNEIITKQQLDTANKNLEAARQSKDVEQIGYAQSVANIYQAQLDIIQQGQKDIAAISAPAKLTGIPTGAVGGGGVPTGQFDAIIGQQKDRMQKLVNETLAGLDLTKATDIDNFKNQVADLAESFNAPIAAFAQNFNDELQASSRYVELLNQGLKGTTAEQVIQLEQRRAIAIAQYNQAIASFEERKNAKDTTELAREAIELRIVDLQNARNALLGAVSTAVKDVVLSESILAAKEAMKAMKVEMNELLDRVNQAKFASEAFGGGIAGGIAGSLSALTKFDTMKERRDLRAEIDQLEKLRDGAKENSKAVEEYTKKIAEARMEWEKLNDTGTRVQEVVSNMLGKIGESFIEMAQKIIAQQVTMIIFGTILKALGISAGSSGGGDYSGGKVDTGAFRTDSLGLGPSLSNWNWGGPGFTPSANGSYFDNGIAAFAKGGMFTNSVVSSPTLFKFADGGAMKTGVMGEAGPEAIMPLRRSADGRLGVEASGLREAMNSSSGGNSGTPTLNMSFETTSIAGVEYVSREQLEQAMAATRRQAANDGAKRGMSMTLDRIQQSPQTRNRLGIR